MAVVLANARDCKAVPARKSDVNDAPLLQRLHAWGLLRASSHPTREIAGIARPHAHPQGLGHPQFDVPQGQLLRQHPARVPVGRLRTACVHGRRFATDEQARQVVMDWISFYNHSKLHSALGYYSLMQFEQRWPAAKYKSAA